MLGLSRLDPIQRQPACFSVLRRLLKLIMAGSQRQSEDSGDSSATLLEKENGHIDNKEDYYAEERPWLIQKFHELLDIIRSQLTRENLKEHALDIINKTRENFIPFLIFLIPSFINKTQPKPSRNAIATLDGLRGYASFGVFTLHFTDTFCQMHNRGWAFDDTSYYLFQLPFVHYLWTADALVATFFVISGYVLSHKPLRLIYAHEDDSFLITMRSAIFRRGIRLYLPSLGAMFICFIFVCIGAFNYPNEVFKAGITTSGEAPPPIFDTFYLQLHDFLSAMWDFTYLFRWGYLMPSYDPHLYTIPVEFQGSMLLFFVTVGVSKVRTGIRISMIAALIIYCGWYNMKDILLFFLGMMLCDMDIYLRETSTESDNKVKRLRWFWIGCFIPGLYLVGLPQWDPEQTPGYETLMWLMNDWYRWQTIGCGLLVWAVRNSDDLKIVFSNRFAQYLGNISFSLYIVHGNVRRSLTYAMVPTLLEWTNGKESASGFVVMVIINTIVTYAAVFWLADLWWRAADLPSIKFARWLETRCSVEGD